MAIQREYMTNLPQRYLDDFVIGDSFESGSIKVTEDNIIAFAEQFDPQPFHLDAAFAAQSFFGGLVASGWHTAALTMNLLVNSGVNIANGLIGLGVDKLRWLLPVHPGDTLRIRTVVIDIKSSPSRVNHGILILHTDTLNQQDVIVQTFVAKLLVNRRTHD